MSLRLAVTPFNAVGDDDLLSKYPIDQLNRDGYINYVSSESIDADYAKDNVTRRTAAWKRKEEREAPAEVERKRGPSGSLDPWSAPGDVEDELEHIHPALQSSQWGLTDGHEDWEAISPSVELASRILDEPHLLPFLHGLTTARPLNDPTLKAEFDKRNIEGPSTWDIHNFDHKNDRREGVDAEQLRQQEQQAAWLHLASFKDQIIWRFDDLKEDQCGKTSWKDHTCIITLNPDFLELLRDELDPAQYSRIWSPGTERESSKHRTQTLLAITIVHEFAHAVWFLNMDTKVGSPDPFLRDRPVNELGYELENIVFSGTTHPIGDPGRMAAPYGLKMVRFPNIYDDFGDSNVFARGAPPEWGVRWTTSYPLKMEWLYSLYTSAYWDRVARFGFRSVKPPRVQGVRVRCSTGTKRTRKRSRSRSPKAGTEGYRDRSARAVVSPVSDASVTDDERDKDL